MTRPARILLSLTLLILVLVVGTATHAAPLLAVPVAACPEEGLGLWAQGLGGTSPQNYGGCVDGRRIEMAVEHTGERLVFVVDAVHAKLVQSPRRIVIAREHDRNEMPGWMRVVDLLAVGRNVPTWGAPGQGHELELGTPSVERAGTHVRLGFELGGLELDDDNTVIVYTKLPR